MESIRKIGRKLNERRDDTDYVPNRKGMAAPSACAWFGGLIITIYVLLVGGLSDTSQTSTEYIWHSDTKVLHASGWYSNIAINEIAGFRVPHFTSLLKFKAMPPLTHVDTWSHSQLIWSDSKKGFFWSRYLRQGSRITFSWVWDHPNNTSPVDVYIIKSTDNYIAWVANKDNKQYFISKWTGRTINGTILINDEDIYYLVLKSSNLVPNYGIVSLSIKAVLYDVSNPESTCIVPCSQHIDIHSKDVIILATPDANNTKMYFEEGFSFSQTNHVRTWLYILVMYVIPVSVLLSLTVAGWMRLHHMKKMQIINEGTCLVTPQSSIQYGDAR